MKVVKESRLFYTSMLKATLGEFLLDPEESHHLIKVLRSSVGDEIRVTNGRGLLMSGEISKADKKKTILTLSDILEEKEKESQVTVAISPTKNIDRFEWFLEKATEIGVQRIVPFICENSERKSIKNERLDKILVSAMKQSGRLWKPVLEELTTFENLIDAINTDYKFIAHCHDEKKSPLQAKDGSVTILIGPEGGFSKSELVKTERVGIKPVSLGEFRLRSETAGIVACQLLSK